MLPGCGEVLTNIQLSRVMHFKSGSLCQKPFVVDDGGLQQRASLEFFGGESSLKDHRFEVAGEESQHGGLAKKANPGFGLGPFVEVEGFGPEFCLAPGAVQFLAGDGGDQPGRNLRGGDLGFAVDDKHGCTQPPEVPGECSSGETLPEEDEIKVNAHGRAWFRFT